jgi:hypothetical protein
MSATFDKSKRSKAFGVYTGCPCSVTLKHGLSTKDKNLPEKVFQQRVDELINQWKAACDRFVPGPTVDSRIRQNWNRAVKQPYGKYAYITCIYDQSAPSSGSSYCKFSLKEKFPNQDLCRVTDEPHKWNGDTCKDCGIQTMGRD